MKKRYLALWLPRFAVDRIERQDPARRDHPFAVILPEAGRLSILSVNSLAAQSGVQPGMTLADGRTLCPRLQAVEADLAGDRKTLEQIQRWCVRYTPWAAPDLFCGPAEGGLLLDISGCAHLFGGEEELLADLSARLGGSGLTHRMAIAGTLGAAWAVSRFGENPSIVRPGPLHEALADLPMGGLRLPPADVETLARLGLSRIGDLYGIPRAALTLRFGEDVRRRLDQALGHSGETLSPAQYRPPRRVHRAFPEPLLQPEAVALVLEELIGKLCQRLESEGLGARKLAFTLCRADGTEADASVGVSRPTRDIRHLARLFAPKLELLDPEPGIDVLMLTATAADPFDPAQTRLRGTRAQAAAAKGETVTTTANATTPGVSSLIDRLANRVGADNVFWQAPVETPLPERQARPALALNETRPDWSTWLNGLQGAPLRPETAGRLVPPRRFAEPEPVDLAPVRDGPSLSPPDRFVWRHRLWRRVSPPVSGPHAGYDGPARLLGPWWRDDATARDYFEVEAVHRTQTLRLWLFQDLSTQHWHVHGAFG